MLEMEQNNDDLLAAISGDKVFIQVLGRGSFKVATPLKQYLAEICGKHKISIIALDLKECIGMDSTFMGVLAGLSGRLKKSGQTLELINLSEKNANLLATLGVDQILKFYNNNHGHNIPEQPTQSLTDNDTASKQEMAETALCAHEKLVQINDENKPRFKRVIELLREDVDRLN